MSQLRDAFETAIGVSTHSFWNESKQVYCWKDFPNVENPADQESWEDFRAGFELSTKISLETTADRIWNEVVCGTGTYTDLKRILEEMTHDYSR